MRRRWFHRLASAKLAALLVCLTPAKAAGDQQIIVRTSGLLDGTSIVQAACTLVGCSPMYGLDGELKKLFLVKVPDLVDVNVFASVLRTQPGILDAEADQVVATSGAGGGDIPPALLDSEPITYYGTTVRAGYLRQPAVGILGILEAQSSYGLTGNGVIVAVIDTGVDPDHPLLRGVLLPGHDFTRNRGGGSERSDVDQSTMAVLEDAQPGFVNGSTMAVLDQSTMAVLDDADYAAFGHGTIVAGVIHLVAPRATILPLKTFRANGTGYASDVLRAIYTAVREGAKVINMSFSFSEHSRELARTIDHASRNGVVAVGSAGNDGLYVDVYPASLPNVIGVASTTDHDTLSDFSNYGQNVAWIAAPGEAIVSTYPFGTYAAAWGTSFSAPFATGAAALLAEVNSGINTTHAHEAEGQGVWISAQVSRGRLHLPAAIQWWLRALGVGPR